MAEEVVAWRLALVTVARRAADVGRRIIVIACREEVLVLVMGVRRGRSRKGRGWMGSDKLGEGSLGKSGDGTNC